MRAEENEQLCLCFFKGLVTWLIFFFLCGLSLPAPIRDGYLNALCYGIRSGFTRRNEVLPDTTKLLPAGFAAGESANAAGKGAKQGMQVWVA